MLKTRALAALFTLTLLSACGPSSLGEGGASGRPSTPCAETPTSISQSPTKEGTMGAAKTSGSVPENLDVRLDRRDKSRLPSDALVRFQVISRGKNPAHNYRWVLYNDGRLFYAKHSGDTSGDYRDPFDTDLPAKPTKTMDEKEVNEVRSQLKKADFADQDSYQVDPSVEDGSFYVVTARTNGRAHEVIYDGVRPPLVTYLLTID